MAPAKVNSGKFPVIDCFPDPIRPFESANIRGFPDCDEVNIQFLSHRLLRCTGSYQRFKKKSKK